MTDKFFLFTKKNNFQIPHRTMTTPSRLKTVTDSVGKSETIESLLDSASSALDEFPPNCEAAANFYIQALEVDENDVRVLDAFGELLANVGDSERAIEVLRKSVTIDPENGGSKYFYLGQMMNGHDSLNAYRKCIEVMSQTGEEIVEEKRERLISIYCLIGELFMTDLADEEGAEQDCEQAFQAALNIDDASVEALTGIATFHRMRLDVEESKIFCSKACQVIATIPGEELEAIVPFSVRMRLAENLVDLEMVDEALDVLATLLEEDEEDIQSWFLTGCCHLVAKEKEEASECIKQAKRLLKKNRQFIDPVVFEHWIKSFIELDSRVRNVVEDVDMS